MPYDPDPLQKVLSKRFRRNGDGLYFVCGGLEGQLPVSEDDLAAAEEELRYQSGKAKAANLVIFGGGTIALYLALLHGRSMLEATIVVLIVALALGIGFHLTAIELALRPFKVRLRQYQREQPGWRPKGFARALRDLGIPLPAVGISLLIALLFAGSALNELRLRNAIVEYGTSIEGQVTRSFTDAKNICRGVYRYTWNSQSYFGDFVGCNLMNRHPVGSKIKLSITTEAPEYSIVEAIELWTDDIIFRLIPLIILSISLCLVAQSGRAYAPPVVDRGK